MARISTYSLDESVSGGDKWIGSDSGFYNKTKNFTPLKLADYFNSSEKIDSSNSLRFWYQTLDLLEERSIGTISFESEVGASVAFSGISSFLLSKNTEGIIYIYDFFNSLIESKILLHKADTINTYAIYEVTAIEEYEDNSEFIKVSVSFIRGNGGLLEDKSYLISVIDFALEASLNWGNIEGNLSDQTDLQEALDLKADISSLGAVAFSNDYNDLDNKPAIPTNTSELTNDGADGVNPFITLEDIPPVTGFVPYTGATQNVDLGEYEIKAGQVEFDQTPTGAAGVGVMRWNDTDGTLDLGLKGGNVTLQLGQEQVARVVNKTATNITLLESNYQVVKIIGATGQRLSVDLAQANNDLNSATTLGVVTETIANNQEGFITTGGQVKEINTTGSLQGETWADGDVLYLSPTTAGKITNIKPTAPNHTIIVGYIEYAHAIHGKIFVKVDNGYELEELHNVTSTNYTTPIDTDSVLTYDVTNSLWKRLSWLNIKSNLKTYFDGIYESLSNKSTSTSLGTSDTLYPTQKAVKTYVDVSTFYNLYKRHMFYYATGAAGGSPLQISISLGESPTGTNAQVDGVFCRNIVSSATAGSSGEIREPSFPRILANKKFYFDTYVSNRNASSVSTERYFYGLTSGLSAFGNIDISAILSSVSLLGIGCDTADTNIHLFHRIESGATNKIDLGFDKTLNHDFRIVLYKLPIGTDVYYSVKNITTGVTQSGTFPFSNTGSLNPRYHKNNGATASAVTFGLNGFKIFIED